MKRNTVLPRILPFMLIISSICSTFSGCTLLPKENTGYALPTVAALEIPDYEMTTITRRDIISSKIISCIYSGNSESKTELFFNVNGINLDDIYVEKGDRVSKGDLLALLNTGDLEERIKVLEEAISLNEFELSHKEELLKLESNKLNVQYKYGVISAEVRDYELEKLRLTYDTSDLEQTLYFDRLEYDALLAQLNNARIYAPFDGVISSTNINYYDKLTMKPDKNKLSVKYDTVLTIVDTSETYFKSTNNYCSYFKDGDIVNITLSKDDTKTYSASIKLDPNDTSAMYLYPLEKLEGLDYGTRAEFVLILDKRENTLAVESSAIKTAGDKKYLYYINEDGYREVRFIETGLNDDNYTEIISGVEYGEAVIKSAGGATK